MGGAGEGDEWEDERGEVRLAVEVGMRIAKNREEKTDTRDAADTNLDVSGSQKR